MEVGGHPPSTAPTPSPGPRPDLAAPRPTLPGNWEILAQPAFQPPGRDRSSWLATTKEHHLAHLCALDRRWVLRVSSHPLGQ